MIESKETKLQVLKFENKKSEKSPKLMWFLLACVFTIILIDSFVDESMKKDYFMCVMIAAKIAFGFYLGEKLANFIMSMSIKHLGKKAGDEADYAYYKIKMWCKSIITMILILFI